MNVSHRKKDWWLYLQKWIQLNCDSEDKSAWVQYKEKNKCWCEFPGAGMVSGLSKTNHMIVCIHI